MRTIHLTRKFGSLTAVSDLQLSIKQGELFGFLGPNGAGKSTTIKMLAGLLQPTEGSALISGWDIRKNLENVKRALGYMPDEPNLYEKLSGKEFLQFVGGLYGIPDQESLQRANRLFDLLGLSEKADDEIQSYSHGMRQKTALSAALLHNPSVLLLDEPLSGLDPRSAKMVKEVLRQFCRRGGTVLLSTHTLEIAERMCDRVGIMNQGRLIAEGSLEDLRSQAKAEQNATLEDLFLQLTGGKEAAEMVEMLNGVI